MIDRLALQLLLPSTLRPLLAFALLAACPILANGQESAGAATTTTPVDGRKPFAAWSASVHSVHDSLISIAKAQVGTRYVLGGQSPDRGFDCSGLVRYVMAALRVELPRTAAQQARVGEEVSRDMSRLRPGDLLTFGKGRRGVSHIGIYIGEGRYVHASSVAGRVIESDVNRSGSPLIRAWRGVRRVVATTGPDSSAGGG